MRTERSPRPSAWATSPKSAERFGFAGLALLGELPLVAVALFVEAQRNGDFGIDEDGAHQCGDQIVQFLPARLAERQNGFRPELLDHRADQAFEDDRMAGDLPARIEPHLALGIRQAP